LSRHNACADAKVWILNNRITTFAQVWQQSPEPAWMLWGLHHAGHEEAPSRLARKWVHQCLLLVSEHLSDPRSLRALKVLEEYAAGSSSEAEMQDALAAATAAVDARTSADAFAQRASPHFYATRAVAASLALPDSEWSTWANEATAYAATAAAQNSTEVHYQTLLDHRQKQASVLRTVFSTNVAGLLANLEHLN
jgi:hypothetical protein